MGIKKMNNEIDRIGYDFNPVDGNELLDELFSERPFSDWVLEFSGISNYDGNYSLDVYHGFYVYGEEGDRLLLHCEVYGQYDNYELDKLVNESKELGEKKYTGPLPSWRRYRLSLVHELNEKVDEEWKGLRMVPIYEKKKIPVFGISLDIKDSDFVDILECSHPNDLMPRCGEIFGGILEVLTSESKKGRVLDYLRNL